MELGHERIEIHDLESVVELQKGPQKISFIPGIALQQLFLWILERPQNVVKMDDDSGIQDGKDIEKDECHVAPDLDDVRRINEQDVTLAKIPKQIERSILNRLANDGVSAPVLLTEDVQQPPRKGVDEGKTNRILQEHAVHVQNRSR